MGGYGSGGYGVGGYGGSGGATLSTLASYVQNRLEELPTGTPGTMWSFQFEILSALAEAQNDLMLLVGRPTQVVSQSFTLAPNTVWQAVPEGIFAITDIQGYNSPLYKINLWDLDYTQSSWGSDWTQDVDVVAKRWAPIAFNLFAIHPAVSVEQTVNITAIQYPQTDVWPYTGTEPIVFSDEFFVALEQYATAYCRLKELGGEAQEGLALFQQYMNMARRLSEISDLRDPLLFSMGFGSAQNVNPTTRR